MIPKINNLLFYTATDSSLVQTIGETQNQHVDPSMSEAENQVVQKRKRALFELIDMDFRIEEYGIANLFIEETYKSYDLENLTAYLISLSKPRMVEYIHSLLSFYKENEEYFQYMRTSPDDFGDKLEELDEDIYTSTTGSSSFEDCIYAAACDIRCYPDKYCRDENGQRINPNFTGFATRKRKDGHLFSEYNIQYGKAHGLCLDYYVHTQKKAKLSSYYKGQLVQVLNEWDAEGHLKYERTHDKEMHYKNGNLFIVKDFKNDLQICYYESGMKKYEATDLDYVGHRKPKVLREWDEEGRLIKNRTEI